MHRTLLAGIVLLGALGTVWLARQGAVPEGEAPSASSAAVAPRDAAPSLAARAPRASRVVTGVVVDEAERPIVGAEVVVVTGEEAGLEGESLARRVLTGPDGRFVYPDPPRDAVARALHADYVEMGHEPVLEAEDGTIEEMRFRLARGATLEGVVRGADGVPWAGGTLRVWRSQEAVQERVLDSRGGYRLERQAAGRVSLQARSRAGESEGTIAGAADLGAGTTTRFDLDGARRPALRGRVVRGGVGVASARVLVQFPGSREFSLDSLSVECMTQAGGEFVVLSPPSAPTAFYVAESTWRGHWSFPEATSDEVVLRLPGGSLRGRVIASGSGEPLARIAVRTEPPEGLEPFGDDLLTDERGEFRIAGLPAGRYDVVAERGAASRDSDWVEAREVDVEVGEAETEVTLRMEAGGSATVVVVDARGTPVPGARVTWRPDGGGAHPSRGSVGTNTEGRATARALLPGPVTIYVSESKQSVDVRADVAVGRRTETRVVVPWLPRGLARIRIVGAKPLPSTDVGLRLVSANGQVAFSGPQLQIDAADPAVRIATLFAGRWKLVVSATGHVRWSSAFEVRPGETSDVDVRLAWRTSEPSPDPEGPPEDENR
jgi:hypothetical protein